MIGPSRRQPGVGRREHIGQPRPPPREDQEGDSRPPGDDAAGDPVTQGFAQMMARFDKLENRLDVTDMRVENLETPLVPDPDPPYDDYDEDEREYKAYRGSLPPIRESNPRNQGLGCRDRTGEVRQRRGDRDGGYPQRDIHRGFGRDTYNTAAGNRLHATQPRQPTCWDPPAARRKPWPDQRQLTSWDPPWARQTTAYQQPPRTPNSRWDQPQALNHQPPFAGRQTSTSNHHPTCWDQHQDRFQQPRPPSCWDPPTPAFEQLPYTYTDSYVPLRNPYAGDHRGQPDYQPLRQPYTDSESHVQPRNSSSGYHPWQPEYRPSRQLPLPDRPLHPPPPPTPRPYSCWDPPGQRTTQAADSRRLSRTVEAAVSGGKRTTWPDIRPYLTSYGESVNKKVDQQRLPNITCSKNDLVDDLWSRGDISGQSSTELQKECHVKTVVPSSKGYTSPSVDGVIVVPDRQEGKGKADDNDIRARIKEQVDDTGRAIFFRKNHGAEPKGVGPLKFTLAPEDQWEELPRLPTVRLKTEVKLFNIHWEEKCKRDAPKFLDTDNASLLGSFLEVPIGQEISKTGKTLGGIMRDQFSLRHVYIEYAIVGYWRIKQRSCPFDPGGIPRLRCFVVSTLRTRWISTVGELIRAYQAYLPYLII